MNMNTAMRSTTIRLLMGRRRPADAAQKVCVPFPSPRALSSITFSVLYGRNPAPTRTIPVFDSVTNHRRLGPIRYHGDSPGPDTPTVQITFIVPPGKSPQHPEEQRISVDARIGEVVLRVAQRHDIDLEGACEGVCACSTCHVILSPSLYDSLASDDSTMPQEDEEDMLDMAFGLTATSRLSCQIKVTPQMENATFQLPTATRNFYVDGHVPKPH
jgi:ferredoxin-2, mitochondrial